MKKFLMAAVASFALMGQAMAGNANMYVCTLTQVNGINLDYVFVRNTETTFVELLTARSDRVMSREANVWRVASNGETSSLTYMRDARFYMILPVEVDVDRHSIGQFRASLMNGNREIASGHCVGSYKEGLQPPVD